MPYSNFAELATAERENQTYRIDYIVRRSPLLILAPHAGGIEPGTGEIATALATETHSLYLFSGLDPGGCARLHIPSIHFDEPGCLALLQTTPVALTIHGCAGEQAVVYTGGTHATLEKILLRHLRHAGYTAHRDGQGRDGTHPANLCNRTAHGGVQLELSAGLRRGLFRDIERDGRTHPTTFFHHFTGVLANALNDFCAAW